MIKHTNETVYLQAQATIIKDTEQAANPSIYTVAVAYDDNWKFTRLSISRTWDYRDTASNGRWALSGRDGIAKVEKIVHTARNRYT